MDVFLIIDKFPILTKSAINSGKFPPIFIKIANFLRSTFLLSNSLVASNNLIIFCVHQFAENPRGLIVLFQGNKIRYLAPDERGILYLLLKVHKILTGEGRKKQEIREAKKFIQNLKSQSTPGIFLKRGVFQNIWDIGPTIGRDFIIFGSPTQNYPKMDSFSDLLERIHPEIVLIFSQVQDFLYEFQEGWNILRIIDDSWKEKFYESEVISYIQSKILERDDTR